MVKEYVKAVSLEVLRNRELIRRDEAEPPRCQIMPSPARVGLSQMMSGAGSDKIKIPIFLLVPVPVPE